MDGLSGCGAYVGVANSSYLKDSPLERALTGDVVLAYEMNGEPLTPEHGFPLRAIVPGYYGTNSVSWLSEISVQAERPKSLFTSGFTTRRWTESSERFGRCR